MVIVIELPRGYIDTVYIDGVNIRCQRASMTRNRPFHHGDLKQTLLTASLKLLDTQGPNGVTIRAVAKLSGVSHAAPVNHFKDRKALLSAVARAVFQGIVTKVQSRLEQNDLDPTERVTLFATVLFDYAAKYPNRYALIWDTSSVDHQDPLLSEVMEQLYEAYCTQIDDVMARQGTDKETFAIALWSMAHGYIVMRQSGLFEARDDKMSGQPRFDAMLALFHQLLR